MSTGGATTASTLSEPVLAALRAAIAAPSPCNTQPWRFRAPNGGIELWLDRDRLLRVADPDAREARISCGAALFNLRITLRVHGLWPAVRLLPDRAAPDLLAQLHFGTPRDASPAEIALAAAVPRRATHRRPFTDRPVLASARSTMILAAGTEGAELTILDQPADVEAVLALVSRADAAQRHDPGFVAELRSWTEGTRAVDGMPRPVAARRGAEGEAVALRRWAEPAGPARPLEIRPLLAVLRTSGDHAYDQLAAGQALQRALLAATGHGVAASFLGQPTELPEVRAQLRDLLRERHPGHGQPQVLLRLGYGAPGPRTPRRPLADVLDPT